MPLSFRQLGNTFIAGPNIGIYPSGNSFAISGSASGSTVGVESISTIGSGLFSIASSVTNNNLVYRSLSGAGNFQIVEDTVADSDATAFINAASITDATQITAINNLVFDLKTNNLWNKMLAIYPIVGGTEASHKFNLKDPRDLNAAYRLVFSGGGWTHSASGMTPNGTSSYADTFLNANSVLTLSSNHLSYYSRTASNINVVYDCGSTLDSITVTNQFSIFFRRTFDNQSGFDSGNAANSRASSVTIPTSSGFLIGSKISNSDRKLFYNGILRATNTVSDTNTLPSRTVYIGAINAGEVGGPRWFGNRQCAFFSIGDGLTDSEVALFNTAVEAYQTTLGRQVVSATTISGRQTNTLTFTTPNVGTIISGTNASTGVNVFCGTTTINNANDTLSFFTLTGGSNVSVTTNDSGEIVIDRGQIVVNTISNQGSGARIFSAITGNSLVQRTIISANTSGFTSFLDFNVVPSLPPIPTSSTDSDATAFITAASITDARQIAAVQNLVSDLKTNNLWNKMQIIYPIVGGTQVSHSYNLKDPRNVDAAFRLAFSGTWIHSSTGMKPQTQNVANRAVSFYNPLSASSLNDAHLSIYVRDVAIGTAIPVGVWDGSSFFQINSSSGASASNVIINGGGVTLTLGNRTGFLMGSRTASNSVAYYINDSSTSATTVSTTRPNGIMTYGCRNSLDNPSNQEIAFSTVGSGLTPSEAFTLNTIVANYQITLGRHVGTLENSTVRIAPTNTTADRFYILTAGPVLNTSSLILPSAVTGNMGVGIAPVTTSRLLLPSGTAAVSQIRLTPFATEPTNPSNGSIWYSTSGNTLKFEKDTIATDFIFLDNNISLSGYPSALIVDSAGTITREYINSFGQFNTLSSVTVTNTAAETSIISSNLIGSTTLLSSTNLYNPELVVGRKFRFNAKGTIQTDNTNVDTLQVRIKLGSTTIGTTSAYTVSKNISTNTYFEIDATFTVRSPNIISCNGKIFGTENIVRTPNMNLKGIYNQNANVTTTSNQVFDCTVQFDQASTNNTIIINESTLEILN